MIRRKLYLYTTMILDIGSGILDLDRDFGSLRGIMKKITLARRYVLRNNIIPKALSLEDKFYKFSSCATAAGS